MEFKTLNHHIIRPRNHGGFAYSSEAKILYYDPALKIGICWESGGSYWSSRRQNYAPSTLSLFKVGTTNRNKKEEMYSLDPELYNEGGRLSKAIIAGVGPQIDEKFGEGTAHYISKNYQKGTIYKSESDLELATLFNEIIGSNYFNSFRYDIERKIERNEARNAESKKKRKDPELYTLNKRLKEIQDRIKGVERTLTYLKSEENQILERIKKRP